MPWRAAHGVRRRERLMECHDDRKRRTQALDKPRHHTAKDGVYGARGARLTHSQTATPGSEYSSTAQDNRLREKNIWMILMKRSQKSGPTAGRRADLQLVKEHSQLQATEEHTQQQGKHVHKENDIAMEIGRNPRLVMRC